MQILDTGIGTAKENMEKDKALLEELASFQHPLLHFYEWDGPAATFGYFAKPAQHLDLNKAAARRVSLARRPTGGGIVFHIWDFAFSFLMPAKHPACSLNTLDNYKFVNQAVLNAVSDLFSLNQPHLILEDAPAIDTDCRQFCMARPTQYDVVHKGMKIAGAAQRKMRQGFLHQGTISLAFPQLEFLKDVLLSKQAVLQAITNYTFAPLGACFSASCLKEARQALKQSLTKNILEIL